MILVPSWRLKSSWYSKPLFFDYGFLDWSAMPVGGRLEEQACVHLKYREALLAAATIHGWLGRRAQAATYRQRADALGRVIRQRFACPGGVHHTLRRIRPGWEKYDQGWAGPSYAADGPNVGPSGPSRHSSACAVFADLIGAKEADEVRKRGFAATGQPPVITPMFLYYEQEALARLGAPAEALRGMRDWLAPQVLGYDASCIWESFEAEQPDFRAWGLHGWPKSLCHGWGAGLVPLAQRWLLGLENLAPGWAMVRLHPPALTGRFSATVPTPQGDIRLERTEAEGPVQVDMPPGIMLGELESPSGWLAPGSDAGSL